MSINYHRRRPPPWLVDAPITVIIRLTEVIMSISMNHLEPRRDKRRPMSNVSSERRHHGVSDQHLGAVAHDSMQPIEDPEPIIECYVTVCCRVICRSRNDFARVGDPVC